MIPGNLRKNFHWMSSSPLPTSSLFSLGTSTTKWSYHLTLSGELSLSSRSLSKHNKIDNQIYAMKKIRLKMAARAEVTWKFLERWWCSVNCHIRLATINGGIGQVTWGAKTAPGEQNGVFGLKLLSTAHAKVLEELNKVFYSWLQSTALLWDANSQQILIKNVKSSLVHSLMESGWVLRASNSIHLTSRLMI